MCNLVDVLIVKICTVWIKYNLYKDTVAKDGELLEVKHLKHSAKCFVYGDVA